MKNNGWSWEWFENGDCKTVTNVIPAVIKSSNGNKVFFNQIIAAYTGWIDKRNTPKSSVLFSDGSQIPEKMINDLVNFMNEN